MGTGPKLLERAIEHGLDFTFETMLGGNTMPGLPRAHWEVSLLWTRNWDSDTQWGHDADTKMGLGHDPRVPKLTVAWEQTPGADR
jgi:hypothetical protein